MAPSTLSLPQLLLLPIGLMLCGTTLVLVEGRVVHNVSPVVHTQTNSETNFGKEMVDEHNAVRTSLGLVPLTWNETVAEYAQRYADQRSGDCQLVHSQGPYGENLYWASGAAELETATAAVKAWVDEKSDYDYATNTCVNGKMCGHYTQVVWKNSQQLGCASVKCSDNAYLSVCSYYPPGNYIGERPY
ncbi:pathogenesis-related protein 1A-like [Telopea speciosissima]|uniref:pathogenesis-related protein 1A-like n=1 Tax=Telopea speciosissima TaxID=54955 RepID=UPI001CC6AFE0|nr:pathogenesis-related protein 1A-like [Telopea speciosissima]